jgi:hypothetical protein
MVGKSLMLKTDFVLNPTVVPEFSSLQGTIRRLLNSNTFSSTLYKTLAGGPKLSWFVPFDGAIDVAKFSNPFDSARKGLSATDFSAVSSTVGKTIDHVSSQVLLLHKEASNGHHSSPTYLYETRLAFTPAAAFDLEAEVLKSEFSKVCSSHHKSKGLAGYAYSTLISPAFDWYIAFENLADLDAVLSDFHKALAESKKCSEFYSNVTSIETCILKKTEEK